VVFTVIFLGWGNNISVLIVVEVTKDIVYVESAQACIWGSINHLLLFEFFKQWLSHLHRLVHLRICVFLRRFADYWYFRLHLHKWWYIQNLFSNFNADLLGLLANVVIVGFGSLRKHL